MKEDFSEQVQEWDQNIKTILSDQEALKKDNDELKEHIRKMDAKAGRLRTGEPAGQMGMESAFAQSFMATETQEQLEKFKRKDIKDFSFELKAVQDMTFSNVFSSAAASVSQVRPGIVAPAPKINHIRDFLPGTTSLTRDYVYVKETSVDGGPSFTREGSTKPQMSFNLSQVTATTQYLAAYTIISQQLLNDVNGMIPYLQGRLIQTLLDKEDTAIITGDGFSPNIGGLHLSGNYTAPSGSATIDIEQIYQAIGQLAALNRQATVIILHPTDYWALQINKASTAGLYSLPPSVSVDADGTMRVAGVKAIWNTAQVSGSFDVLDAVNGTLLVQRELPRCEFFIDSTLAQKNEVMVRVEERLALCVYASTYDIYGTF